MQKATQDKKQGKDKTKRCTDIVLVLMEILMKYDNMECKIFV